MRHVRARLAALAAGVILLISAYHRTDSPAVMSEAANRFLSALTPEQKGKAVLRFEDDERQNWHFVPRERKGLPLREMSPAAETPRRRAAGRRPQPAGLHQGHHHHEPRGRAEGP